MPSEEVFSNPIAPAGETVEDSKPQRLTNADFRKLLMTPRVPTTSVKEAPAAAPSTVPTGVPSNTDATTKTGEKKDVKESERKKKKSYYARMKKEEEEKMAELAEKYRDRARERREGKNPDYQVEDPTQAGMGAYRAVAPDLKSGYDAAERRKQMIQESKFLGGDMEHTHLVKGLDYALLQKVRSEITFKEQEIEIEKPVETKEKKPPAPVEEEELTFKTTTGRRIYNSIFFGKSDFGDIFQPGRVAYTIDLEEDAENDIPITVLRSKTDVLGVENTQTTFTTNDIVIQKLTQILSYLRTGRASKKQKKKGREPGKNLAEDSIYGEIGDYVPSVGKPDRDKDRDKGRDRDRDRRDRDRYEKDRDKSRNERNEGKEKRRSYFSRPPQEDVQQDAQLSEERFQNHNQLDGNKEHNMPQDAQSLNEFQRLLLKRQVLLQKETNFYTECYPGMAEMQDAIEDSDDEADYTKMDLGNKKGPVGRWDFDTQEEYSDYMNQREAMPKAAFQYGVKMADGRKTRRIGGKEKDKNAELNREWQQIQQIIKRRKENDLPGGGEKKARYDY